MEKRIIFCMFVFMFLISFVSSETYSPKLTINVGSFYKVYVSVLHDTDGFSKITSFSDYPNHENLITKTLSVNESSIKLGISVKDKSDKTLLNKKYGPFETNEDISLDLREDLDIDTTFSTSSQPSNVSETIETNQTEELNQTEESTQITPEITTTNEEQVDLVIENQGESELKEVSNEQNTGIIGWSIFKDKENKLRIIYPILGGAFIAFVLGFFIFRRYSLNSKPKKIKKDFDEDLDDEDFQKEEEKLLDAEKKIEEAKKEIEKLKFKHDKVKQAEEEYLKAKERLRKLRDLEED
jgi:hypothetical protein